MSPPLAPTTSTRERGGEGRAVGTPPPLFTPSPPLTRKVARARYAPALLSPASAHTLTKTRVCEPAVAQNRAPARPSSFTRERGGVGVRKASTPPVHVHAPSALQRPPPGFMHIRPPPFTPPPPPVRSVSTTLHLSHTTPLLGVHQGGNPKSWTT